MLEITHSWPTQSVAHPSWNTIFEGFYKEISVLSLPGKLFLAFSKQISSVSSRFHTAFRAQSNVELFEFMSFTKSNEKFHQSLADDPVLKEVWCKTRKKWFYTVWNPEQPFFSCFFAFLKYWISWSGLGAKVWHLVLSKVSETWPLGKHLTTAFQSLTVLRV